MTATSSPNLTHYIRPALLATSIAMNLAFLTALYIAARTPYLNTYGLQHFTTKSCGEDRTYMLSHDAADAQRFYRVAICNEGLRSNPDGTYAIDNAAVE